jgi:diguanylate cyclase (GGDEF)-like protein
VHEDDQSVYARQLSDGFKRLRFEQPLERDFRHAYIAGNLEFVRWSLGLGLLMVVLLCLLDWQILPPEFSRNALLLRGGVMVPAIFIALWSTYPHRMARYVEHTLMAAAAAVGVGAIGVGLIAHRAGVEVPFSGLVVTTIYIYLLLGLRLVPALTVATPLLGSFLMLTLMSDQRPEAFWYQLVFIVFANIIGVAGCYKLEHAGRTIFLENQILNILAGSDALTGIPNRRMFNSHLQSVWRQAQRDSRGLAVGLIDVDYFKRFNDRYGHQAGDVCLRRIAHTIMRCARRPLDFTARFGGEEFAVVLFDPDPDYIEKLANRIRTNIAVLDIPHEDSDVSERVTVSIGMVLAGPDSGRSAEGLLQLADEALYEAKEAGRNCVAVVRVEQNQSATGVFRGPWAIKKEA